MFANHPTSTKTKARPSNLHDIHPAMKSLHSINSVSKFAFGGFAVATLIGMAVPAVLATPILVDTNTFSVGPTTKVNFTNGAMVVRTATVGTPTAGIYNGLSRYAQTGLNLAGAQTDWWWGPGFASSNARATAQTDLTLGIGVVDNNHAGDLGGYLYGPAGLIATNFVSIPTATPLVGTEILSRVTYWGDADMNGLIDGTDYALIDTGFNTSLNGWFYGDFDYTGTVDGTDYALIDNAFNNQGAPLTLAGSGKSAGVVPEPGSLGLLALGALGVFARRARGKAETTV